MFKHCKACIKSCDTSNHENKLVLADVAFRVFYSPLLNSIASFTNTDTLPMVSIVISAHLEHKHHTRKMKAVDLNALGSRNVHIFISTNQVCAIKAFTDISCTCWTSHLTIIINSLKLYTDWHHKLYCGQHLKSAPARNMLPARSVPKVKGRTTLH